MQKLTELIREDMKPALGVTEPGAIAFAVASAKKYTEGKIVNVHVALNSGMYKNAFTCGIPNSERFGNYYAAALGAVAADAEKGLESLADITPPECPAASLTGTSGAASSAALFNSGKACSASVGRYPGSVVISTFAPIATAPA